MGGGILNIVAYGNQNIILNGNPSKSFFTTTYAKYTNFGMQKFRLSFDGPKVLQERTDSTFFFTIPRYADLLLDTYFVIDMPNIWSPIYVPGFNYIQTRNLQCQPYEFKWIKNLGAQLIRKITISIGHRIIQQYSGQYLLNKVTRDYTTAKKKLFDEMIGNVAAMNDPANYGNNNGHYPSVLSSKSGLHPEPSIRARRLYIPLNLWYMLSSSEAFPLLALDYNKLTIRIDCRPIRELFVVRDMEYYINNYFQHSTVSPTGLEPKPDVEYQGTPYISTMTRFVPEYQMYLFLTTEGIDIFNTFFKGIIPFDPAAQSNWYADPHLICTYVFLHDDERLVFKSRPQTYLIREVHETVILSSAHTDLVKTRFVSSGLIANWMWFFQRNDANLRNEWSNYTNWLYEDNIPYLPIDMYGKDNKGNNLTTANPNKITQLSSKVICPPECSRYLGDNLTLWVSGKFSIGIPYWGISMDHLPPYFPMMYVKESSGINPMISGPLQVGNDKYIMKKWSLLCDGKLRENDLDAGVLNMVEKYARSSGGGDRGVYFYNFGLTTDPADQQPTGAMNMTPYLNIEFEYKTITPPLDLSSVLLAVCANRSDGKLDLVGYNNPRWRVYEYNYDLLIMEERYNLLTISGGLATLEFTNHV